MVSLSTVGCRLTWLASFDLGGGIAQSLSNKALANQANVPAVLAEFLQRQQQAGSKSPLLALLLSNAAVLEQIFKPILG